MFDLQIHKNLETAEKIRALLDKHEKSQKELAEFLGVSENGLSGMMKNNSFKHQNMMKIARFFNVDLSFFNTNSGNVSHSQNEAGSASKESLIAAYEKQIQYLERLIQEKDRTLLAKDELISTLKSKIKER